eukprot:gene4314-7670_t
MNQEEKVQEKDPIVLFQNLHEEYKQALSKEKLNSEYPYIMTIATCTKDGFPSARQVLLKYVKPEGFIFFTNYESRKSKEIQENPNVALVFYWREIGRQIRVEGTIEKTSSDISDNYFNKRPRNSQINSILSKQSQVLKNEKLFFEEIEKMNESEETTFKRPSNWGGYLIRPNFIEFWKNGHYRLHERLKYSHVGNNEWKTEFLYP